MGCYQEVGAVQNRESRARGGVYGMLGGDRGGDSSLHKVGEGASLTRDI